MESLLETIFTRRQESLNILKALLLQPMPTLSTYLVNRMIFIKMCRQDPLELSRLIKPSSYFSYESDKHADFKNFLVPLRNRNDYFPLDRPTIINIINSSSTARVQYSILGLFKSSSRSSTPLVDQDRAILQDFEIYAPQLLYLRNQMQAWRPQGFRDFFIVAYNDRLSWFTAMVGLMFGVLGLVGVVSSLLQGVVATIALAVAYESLKLQRLNQTQS